MPVTVLFVALKRGTEQRLRLVRITVRTKQQQEEQRNERHPH